MPYNPRCFNPEKYSADSRSVLLGTVPVLMQLPPTASARSITATRLPKYAACAPAFSPAGPHPITIKSKESAEATNTSVKRSGPVARGFVFYRQPPLQILLPLSRGSRPQPAAALCHLSHGLRFDCCLLTPCPHLFPSHLAYPFPM